MKNGSKLEKLSMKGFKSFSHRTSLIFSPGITAIVGPNGSGKSNVIDAISFVMGSLSFSSLRAKSAENLLHFGKTTKAKSAVVELSIKTDREDVAKDGHVRLNRKLVHDGTSVYRVNGRRSTRLAIMDTLGAMHIFPDSHNIIQQGEITKFINMSPREKRELIEVVAGVELYERKKRKAMSDLESVEAKTEKVEAVHGERMRIFKRLKTEKDKVSRFHQLKDLEERARFGLLLNKIRSRREDIEGLLGDKESKEGEIGSINAEIEGRSKELAEVNSELEERGLREKVEAMTQLERLRMELDKLGEERERGEKTIERSESRLESIGSQIEGLKRRRHELTEKAREKKGRLAEARKKAAELKKEKGEVAARLSREKQDFERRKEEYEKLKERRDKLTLEAKELELELNSVRRVREELERRLAGEEELKLKLESERRKALEEQKSLEKEAREIKDKLKELVAGLKTARGEEKELLYASGLPAGVRALRERGYPVLGEIVDDPREIMPFALSVVAPREEAAKLEKGWAFIVPEGYDLNELKELSSVGVPAGRITEHDFRAEGERDRELREVRGRIEKLEREADSLRQRGAETEGLLGRKPDPHRMKRVSDGIKLLKGEIKERTKEAGRLEAGLEKLRGKLEDVGELEAPEMEGEGQLDELASEVLSLESEAMRLESEIQASGNTLKNLVEPDIENYVKLQKEMAEEIEGKKGELAELTGREEGLRGQLGEFRGKIESIDGRLKEGIGRKTELEDFVKDSQTRLYQLKADITVVEERVRALRAEIKELESTKPEGMEPVENPEAVLEKVGRELEALGTLNFRAGEEFQEINQMVEDISDKLDKLRAEKDAIVRMMDEIEEQKRRVFMETFDKISESFTRIFSEVMEGESRLELDDEDPFEAGLHIKANVRGRELPTESLSGGQKTLAALALIFAIQEVKPSPFYIFDEVDAALDKTNSEKLAYMLKKMGEGTQIITITHNDIVVRDSDQIVGVYMKGGSSRLVSLPKEKVMAEAESWIGKGADGGTADELGE